MACPPSELLLGEASRLLTDKERCVLKIIVTRGEGGRGYRAKQGVEPCRILGRYPWPDYPVQYATDGVRIRICRTRLVRNPALAGIKHLNRLEQVIARNEWQDDSIAEGLMLDSHDKLIEGTMSNLFLIKGQKLLTPELTECGIEGIIRKNVLNLAGNIGLDAVVCEISKDELNTADEVFLCNSIIGIWPVRHIEKREFAPGIYTEKVRQQLLKKNIILV